MSFHSNPFDEETVYSMSCEAISSLDETYVHIFFEEFPVFDGQSSETLTINRTEQNMLYFSLDFGQELEFIPISDNVMYYREQEDQVDDQLMSTFGLDQVDDQFLSTFGSVEGLSEFKASIMTYKLYESNPVTLGITYSQDTNLESVPQRNNSIQVAKQDGFTLFGRYPVQFVDTLSEIIKISPESAKRLAQDGSQYKFIVNLRFDFFKKEFEYQFYGLTTFFT